MKQFYKLYTAILIALSYFICFALDATAQPGTLNPNFNPNVYEFFSGVGPEQQVLALATQNDGKTYVTEDFTEYNENVRFKVASLNLPVPTAPTITSAISGNAQVTVAFTAPTSNGGSPVTSYTVTSSPGGISATGPTNPIIVTGLTNGQAYTFRVSATNAIGVSPLSAASASVTPSTVPGAPTITSITAGVGYAFVNITPGFNGGLPITQYVVTANPGNIQSHGTSLSIPVPLTPGQQYTITVRAYNAKGFGSASLPVAATSLAAPPKILTTYNEDWQMRVDRKTGYVVAADGSLFDPYTHETVLAPVPGTTIINLSEFALTYDSSTELLHTGNSSTIDIQNSTITHYLTYPIEYDPHVPVYKITNDLYLVSVKDETFFLIPETLSAAGVVYYYTILPTPPRLKQGFTPGQTVSQITSFSPTSATSGTTVTINGINFTSAFAVSFGGVPASSFLVVNDTQITAVVPSGASGEVRVLTHYNLAKKTGFTHLVAPSAPTISSASAGDRQATVSFTANSAGSSPITSYTVSSNPGNFIASGPASPITVTGLTNGTAYTFTVKATSADGTSDASAASQAVTPAIAATTTIASFSPTTAGPGTTVTITGTGFTGVTAVSFGGVAATSFNVVSATTITAVVGIAVSGSVNVTIPSGTATLAGFVFDNTGPVVTITSPTTATSYITASAITALSGTASDNAGIASVTWMNLANGASGTATGTTSWSVPSVSLVTGSNTVTITATDEAGNTGTDDLTYTLQAAQLITFTALADKTYGDADFALTATGGASGNAITYTSSNTGVATIVDGSVHIVGAGSTNITASQTGNDNYKAAADVVQSLTINRASATITLSNLIHVFDGSAKSAQADTDPTELSTVNITYNGSATPPSAAGVYSVIATLDNANYSAPFATATLTISKANQVITFTALADKTYGDADFALTATGGISGNPITYTSSNTGVATIVDGSVHIVGAGSTNITASQTGNDNYKAAADVVQTLTINRASATITLSNLNHVFDGSAKSAQADTDPTELSTVNITYNGSATPPSAAGVYSVIATLDNANYSAPSATATLTISKANQVITFTALADKTYGDADFALTATGGESGNAITYTSSNIGVATIVDGSVHIVGAGSTNITASQTGNDNYKAAADVVQSLTINRASATITLSNLIHVFDGSAKSAQADTDPTELSTVNITYNGSATPPSAAGVYSVIATLDNANYSAPFATATLTISKANQVITFTALADKTYGDADFALTATGGISGNPITYTSSNTGVATIVDGSVHIVGAGSTNITASQTGNDNYKAAADVVQTLTINRASATITLSNLIHVFDGSAKSAQADTDPTELSTVNITYNGSATPPSAAGVYSVIATLDNANYSAPFATATLTISKANQVITFTALADKTYGDADFALTATGGASGNAITYTSSNTGVATIVDGSVHIVGAGSTNITASQAGSDNYNVAADFAQSLTVNKASALITMSGATYVYDGSVKTLTAATSPANLAVLALTYNGSSAAPTEAGTYTVTATITNANYAATPVTAQLLITMAQQEIVWNNPAAIDYGTPLSPAQLNASAPGVLTYSPAAGTLLNTGTHVLSVSAAATNNYTATTKSVTLVVNQATATLSLSNLSQTYDGMAKPVIVSTTPSGLTGVSITYNGSVIIPISTGTYSVLASLNNFNYTAAPVSGTLTITQPPLTLKVQYLNKDNQVSDGEIKPYLKIVNAGTVAVPYNQITARYWLTPENYTGALRTFVDHAAIGNNKVSMRYVMLQDPRVKALGYVEYSFSASSGSLAAGGNSDEIQSRISNTDGTDFEESNDHSYDETKGNKYIDNSKITLYRNGVLIWGTEPVTEAPLMKLKMYAQDRNGSPSSMNTYIDIRNEGNIPIDYKDVIARYWFTSEGAQPLTFSVDYAKIGNSFISGSFTKLANVRTNADTYLELNVRPVASTFYPLTSTDNIQYRINKSDWSKFNQANDHSYKSGSMSENAKITIYYKGQLVYGTEPTPMLAPLFMTVNHLDIADGKEVSIIGNPYSEEDSKESTEATNALTPNGDGKNDTWIVRNLDIGNFVKIYDRNGRQVFSTKNYANDWDGTSQGLPLPEGTYYYMIEFGQGKAPSKGYVSILR